MDSPISRDVSDRAGRIKLLLMDVDGVLTDGNLYYYEGANGVVETKGLGSQDGLGLHFCHFVGLRTGVISGRTSPAVTERARELHMTYVYQGHLEKVGVFEQILKDAGVADNEVAFIGDDLTDAPLMKRSGLAVAVANARPEVLAIAHLVTRAQGGQGAVREVIEVILKAQGLWESILAKYNLAGS